MNNISILRVVHYSEKWWDILLITVIFGAWFFWFMWWAWVTSMLSWEVVSSQFAEIRIYLIVWIVFLFIFRNLKLFLENHFSLGCKLHTASSFIFRIILCLVKNWIAHGFSFNIKFISFRIVFIMANARSSSNLTSLTHI